MVTSVACKGLTVCSRSNASLPFPVVHPVVPAVCLDVFIQHDAHRSPLWTPYDGPIHVLEDETSLSLRILSSMNQWILLGHFNGVNLLTLLQSHLSGENAGWQEV